MHPEALRDVRMWVHDVGTEWTDEDIETVAWLMAHTEATITCDLDHPDFARAMYRQNRMLGVPRGKTLAGMAEEFPAAVVVYVRQTER